MRTDEIKAYLRQYRESLGRSDELTAHLAELRDECDSLRDHEGQRVELDAAVAKFLVVHIYLFRSFSFLFRYVGNSLTFAFRSLNFLQ